MREQLHGKPENKTWVHFQRGKRGKWGSGIIEWEKVGRGRKREFYGAALHEGSPRPAVCDLGAVENYVNPCVVSKSANRSAQSHEDKIISTSGNMVAFYQRKNQVT